MNHQQYLQNRMINALHTGLLLLAMAALLAGLGWIIMGWFGLILLLLTGMAFLFLTPSLSTGMSMRLMGARLLQPHELAPIHHMLVQLAKRAELPALPRLYLLPNHEINAFAMGSGRDAAIAISSGLLRRLDRREILGVLAHEVSHIALGDTRILTMAAQASHMTRTLAFFGMLITLVYLPLYLTMGHGIPLLLIVLLLSAPLASTWLQLALSRTREFAADMKAAALTEDPRGLASALNTLELSRKGSFFERLLMPRLENKEPKWLRSHPPTRERIRRLLEVQAKPVMRPLTHQVVFMN